MAKSCIFKIIMGGSAGSGKTSFLNNREFTHHNNDNYFHIGVNFKLIDCLVNNEDNYLLQIWDFKVLKDFQFLYPSFCKGAKGALLFFDSDYNSFKELSFWIKTIRNIAGNIPIILIGTEIDVGNREVLENEINDLIRINNVNSVFYTSVKENDQNIIFKHLIESVDHYSYIQEFSILASEVDENFENFIRFFSDCPLCGRSLHSSYLKRFFYSRNRKTISLKNRLLELIEESKDYDELYYNDIKIGITCCKCFKGIFE